MKKKIAILGSTGSIGKNTLELIKKDKKNFKIILLTTNKNLHELKKQINQFKVQNVIINDYKSYLKFKKDLKKKINVFNNFNSFMKKNKKKVDYTMCSISGLAGLEPTIIATSFSKKIAIANKESIICGWNLIHKNLKKNKTEFIPVDSEHFSIWSLINKTNFNLIDKIIITASGGPFLNWSNNKIKSAKPKFALKHPNWSMGKKISIDSATLMNKVFEVIEAQRIFNIPLSKFEILIHQKSYVHTLIKFRNGLTKILIHDTDMQIPIYNTIYQNSEKKFKTKKINLNYLNNLNFKKVDKKKFPSINILKQISNKNTLFETIVVSANDELVNLYLQNKIKFNEIYLNLFKIISLKEFSKYKRKSPKNINEINKLHNYVRLKTKSLCI